MRIKLFALSKESESSESSDTPLVEVSITIIYNKNVSDCGCYYIKFLDEFDLVEVEHLPFMLYCVWKFDVWFKFVSTCVYVTFKYV